MVIKIRVMALRVGLLPLDGSGGLRGDVVANPIYSSHLIDDAVSDLP